MKELSKCQKVKTICYYLEKAGKAYGLGANTNGQLGDGTNILKDTEITTGVIAQDGKVLENVTEISAGDRYSTLVTKERKSIHIWSK